MKCEICGVKDASLKARVEGSVVEVCEDCSKFGEVLAHFEPSTRRIERRIERGAKMPEETVLVSDYGKIVRGEREKRSWSQKDLAMRINEKESLVRGIEHEGIAPTDKVRGKLEKLLEIGLSTTPKEVFVQKAGREDLTLGDLVKVKKK